jgi:hypothetical protein
MLYTHFVPTAPGKWSVEGMNGLIATVTVGKKCAIVPTHELRRIESVTMADFMRTQHGCSEPCQTVLICANNTRI